MRFVRVDQREDVLDQIREEMRLQGVAGDIADQAVADYLGLNRTDSRCLDIIERLDGVTAGRLAAESGLSTGAVTTVLDRLERAGFARRVQDPDDRRRVLVELTPAARARLDELYGPLDEDLARQRDGYSTEEACLVRDFMREARRLNEAHAARIRARVRAAQAQGQDGDAASYRSARSSSRSASDSMRVKR